MSSTIEVFNLSGRRRRLRVSGADRVAFLHGQCTNEVRHLQPGQACYAAFLTAKGKMRGDADIVCVADAFLLSTAADLQSSLEKFVITEDVVIEDISAAMGEWAVWGAEPSAITAYANRLNGWNVLGVEPGGESITVETYEIRRIQAGVPLWGQDLDETTIPVEAGLAGWGISYEKGCYIGQETIARIKTYGHVNRQLVQLQLDTCPVVGAAIDQGDRVVGTVTSATAVPELGKALALGYVRRDMAEPGATVMIANQPAEVLKRCGD